MFIESKFKTIAKTLLTIKLSIKQQNVVRYLQVHQLGQAVL